MNSRRNTAIIFATLVLLCAANLAIVLYLRADYLENKSRILSREEIHCWNEVDRVAGSLNQRLEVLKPVTEQIAQALADGSLRREEIPEAMQIMLQNMREQVEGVRGIGVAFVPRVDDPRYRETSPYYAGAPPEEGKTDPGYIKLFSTTFTHAAPGAESGAVSGEVFIDFDLDELKKLMSSLDLGRAGYGYLLSRDGGFLYHPQEEFVTSGKTIFQVADALGDDLLRALGEKAVQGDSGLLDHVSGISGESSWIFFEHVPATGWSLGIVFIKSEMFDEIDTYSYKLVGMGVAIGLFAICLSTLVLGAYRGGENRLWLVSTTASLVFLGIIGLVWHLTLAQKQVSGTVDAVISDKAALSRFLARQQLETGEKFCDGLVTVPTGIYLQSAVLTGPDEVTVSGLVWQEYTAGRHDGLTRGFLMPDAVSLNVRPAYSRTAGGVEALGWYFESRVRQQFSYSRYPFDNKRIRIQLRHADFRKNVMLEPLLNAYEFVNYTARPGLAPDIDPAGWDVRGAFFSFQLREYKADLGVDAATGSAPELCLNVDMRRQFLNPFIANMLPLISVMVLLFGMLMIISKRSENVKMLGFGSARIISACSAFFFVVAFYQIDLRTKLQVAEIIYLEYFFFVVYIAILAVAINSILFATSKHPIIQFRDNFLSKVLFWPVTLAVLVVITVVKLTFGK